VTNCDDFNYKSDEFFCLFILTIVRLIRNPMKFFFVFSWYFILFYFRKGEGVINFAKNFAYAHYYYKFVFFIHVLASFLTLDSVILCVIFVCFMTL